MLALRKLAITGGISSGKSTVCRLLKELGGYVVDADEIVHTLLSKGSFLESQVIQLLGPSVIVGNQIDRKKIADIVFNHPEKLKKLEKILHPAVAQEIHNRYEAVCMNPSYRFFAAEVPLLFEAGMENDFDAVICVTTDTQAAQNRSHLSPEDFLKRSQLQAPLEIKASKADYLICNNTTLQDLKENVTRMIQTITGDA